MGPFENSWTPEQAPAEEKKSLFGFLSPEPPNLKKAGIMRISLKKLDPRERYHVKYRAELERCELLGHWAYDADRSIQRIIDEKLFKRTWRSELEEARERHRKAGKKDYSFYPSSVKKAIGLKSKPGRRKLKKNLMSVAA